MFGEICRATSKAFLLQLRQKSDAKNALCKYLVLLNSQCPGIGQHLQLSDRFKDTRVPGLSVVYTDRGGEMTTTFGYTESEFDEILRGFVHRLYTPDTAQSGASRIERLWLKLSTAARCSLLSSGLAKKYYFDAMVMASDVRNRLPTACNRLGDGGHRTRRSAYPTTCDR